MNEGRPGQVTAIRYMREFIGCSNSHSAGRSRGAGRSTLRSQVAHLTLFFSILFSVLKEFFVGRLHNQMCKLVRQSF